MKSTDDIERLLLAVWKHLGLQPSLPEAVARIALLVRRQLPLSLLIVRRLDVVRSRLETLAAGAGGSAPPPRRLHSDLRGPALQRLLAGCAAGGVHVLSRSDGRDAFDPAVPDGVRGEIVAGPLTGPEGPLGVLLVVAPPGESFAATDHELVETLLEPFAAALLSHCRLHTTIAEREAAQADRRSLLTRLGTPEVGEVVVGADAGLREVMEDVRQVSQSDVPVLIFGETGSGKEVVARAIHTRSRRAAGAFLRVNCGAIPAELVDSELFGHERGSFTGATRLRKGWFERADGGTLFLDEIAELSAAAQVRLLRVLQDGTFERVGGQHELRVDVRIVAATHRDLYAMVAEGAFREDLWYRLAVFPVDLPSLRDRREDIPALASHFAQQAARRFGLPYAPPTREDIDLLAAYSWPGNIRELAAVIDRAAIIGGGDRLEIAGALGVNRGSRSQRSGAEVPGSRQPADNGRLLRLDEVIRAHIEKALEATGGRIEGAGGAGHLLGVNPHTLRSRMRKLGLDWTRFRRAPPCG